MGKLAVQHAPEASCPEAVPPPVQLERVGAISMRALLLQVLWQVDDHDGIERAFLHVIEFAGSQTGARPKAVARICMRA